MADLVGQQLGNYQIVQLLGRGGFAEVYLGKHSYLGSYAALKVLHTTLSNEDQVSFAKEAKTLVSLRHPHIVRLLDFAIEKGRPFLVMDYAPGGTLRQQHAPGSRLPLDTVVRYVQQMASALYYAHSQQLIHRDIKPENMLVVSQDTILLGDFGLALFTPTMQSYSTHATIHEVAGTSLYLAPEQLQGRPEAASDQYALAVVVYEWLCGKTPFSGTLLEVAMQHLSMHPPSLREQVPDLPLPVEDVVLQALEKQPRRRFADVQEFARTLEWAYLEASQHTFLSTNSLEKQELVSFEHEQQMVSVPLPKPERIWKTVSVLTSLVGREQDVAAVCGLLASSGVRLVTLLGTGGVGKTRLSLQVVVEMREHFVDGACFVPLASVSDPERVISTIAQELGIQDTGALSILEHVKSFLQKKHMLLVLDNFEQVVTAAPVVHELLTACPHLSILVTSREVLHVQGEHEFLVSPLFVPDLTHPLEGEALTKAASVVLFLQRAQSILPNFKLTSTNVRAIAEICVRLDGLPLAIELAAARIKILPPQALLTRLSHRFEVLTSGMQTLPLRQQTLRNTLKWSYDLLNLAEQRLFRRLAVFVNGWTLEAVEVVCYYDMGQKQVAPLDEVSSLLDKSLLLLLEREGEDPRLQMLMTVRAYGLECLRESNEIEQTYQAHALYYLSLAEEAERYRLGHEQTAWLTRLKQEHNNFRTALQWLSEMREYELMARLAGALCWFWSVHGHIKEGYLWIEKILAESEGLPALVQAKALNSAGALAYHLGKYNQTELFCQQSLVLYRQLNDKQGCAEVLYWLGLVACWVKQDYVQARAYVEEGLALHTECSNTSGMADALLVIAYIGLNRGDYAEARLYMEQSLARFREANDSWGIAYTLRYLGRVLLELGDIARASAVVEESLTIATELGYASGIAYASSIKGHIALRQGNVKEARILIADSLVKHRERGQQAGIAESLLLLAKVFLAEEQYAEARQLYEECLVVLEKLDEQDTQASCLEGLGAAVLGQGKAAWAVLLWGATAKLREVRGIPMPPLERTDHEQVERAAGEQLGEQTFTALWRQGYSLTPEQALATQEPMITPKPAPAKQKHVVEKKLLPPMTYPDGLTTREVEVLRLLAQGWTDAQIAEQLVISPRTVNKHTTTIYRKIGVSSRGAATRYAIEHKLV